MADETPGRGTGVYANFITESGTRRGTRALGPFRQAVLVLRWFADNTRVRQLACDFDIGKSTAYDYLHEGIDVLADIAPDVHEALLAARARGASHATPAAAVACSHVG